MKRIFWNEDTQKDFMNPDGKLPIPEAELIKLNLRLLTAYAKRNGIYVVNTGDWHNKQSEEVSDTPDFKTTFPMHCEIETEGAEFVPETLPENPYTIDWRGPSFDAKNVSQTRNLVIYKNKFSIFEGTPYTQGILEILKPELVVVYGVATDVCVKQAVLGLQQRKYPCYVIADAIKGITKERAKSALEEMARAGAKFVTTLQVLEGRLK